MGTRERGLVLGGRVVADSVDRVVRAPQDAWFEPGSRGTRRRARRAGKPRVDLIVSHWTAGREHIDVPGPENDAKDDAGIRVFRSFRSRLRADGSPMEVGTEFVIAASDADDARAEIWQLADPLETACVHVSTGWNPRSIGIERCMPGTRKQAKALGVGLDRPVTIRSLAGEVVTMVDFYPAEIEAFVWLIDTLARELSIPRVVPVDRDGYLLRRRMTPAEARSAVGLLEHYHSPSTSKFDTGSLAIEQAQTAGWKTRCFT